MNTIRIIAIKGKTYYETRFGVAKTKKQADKWLKKWSKPHRKPNRKPNR